MIKTINGSGRYVMVSGGMPSPTYVNTSSGYMNVGDVRYNTSLQRFEVYDGNMWVPMSESHASVGLTPDAESALDWARMKMMEEKAIEAKAKDNPAIADLLNKKREIEDQIKMVEILTREEVKVGTN